MTLDADAVRRDGSLSARLALALVRAYQLVVSPHLPPSCRFFPTCSQHAAQAIEMHGLARGAVIALKRLARCHPFARPGYDPVR